MEIIKKYSEEQTHRKVYPNGNLEAIIENSKHKAYNYMYDKANEGMDYVAISYYGNLITYRDVFEQIEHYARALKNYGIGKGDFVTLVLPNIPEVVYIKYALNRIGATSNLIDPRTNPDRILSYVNNTKSKMIISSLEVIKTKIEPIKNKVRVDNILTIPASNSMNFSASGSKEKMIYLLLKYKEMIFKLEEKLKSDKKYILDKDFFSLYGRQFSGILDTEYEENQPFAVYYTSGSSGIPKGVLESNEAYNAMIEQMTFGTDATTYQKGETFLGIIPFFSSYGSLSGMHNSLCRNWNIILVPKFNPNEFDILLAQYKPNNALGVPRFWETIVKNKRVNEVDFSFLKRPVTGGDKITLKSIEEINEFLNSHGATGVKLKVGYGASEFGGCVSATLDEFDKYNPTTSGYILLGCGGMVINPETKEELQIGEIGEICISSPSMMLGYLNHQKETDDITIYDKQGNKYYRTGDKGYIDKEGSLYIIDRYKRVMMRPDGHTVHASPIEDVIMSDDRVESCVVVGLKEKDLAGTIPTAFIKLKDSGLSFDKFVEELDAISIEQLPERDKALAYSQVSDMEYTLMGKIDYRYYEKLPFEEVHPIVKDFSFFPHLVGKKLIKRI